jgi:hypothetical protein
MPDISLKSPNVPSLLCTALAFILVLSICSICNVSGLYKKPTASPLAIRATNLQCRLQSQPAVAVERHITLDRSMYGSDQAASLEPHGLVDTTRKIPNIITGRWSRSDIKHTSVYLPEAAYEALWQVASTRGAISMIFSWNVSS